MRIRRGVSVYVDQVAHRAYDADTGEELTIPIEYGPRLLGAVPGQRIAFLSYVKDARGHYQACGGGILTERVIGIVVERMGRKDEGSEILRRFCRPAHNGEG